MNDLFYFIEKRTLYTYADDDQISMAAPTLDGVCNALQHDGNIATEWFQKWNASQHCEIPTRDYIPLPHGSCNYYFER